MRLVGDLVTGADGGGELMPRAVEEAGAVYSAAAHPRCYAVRVVGDGLVPVVEHGEFLLIDPETPAGGGSRVLIVLQDRSVLVRKLLFERDGRLTVCPLAGGQHTTIERQQVRSIERIFATYAADRWEPA